MTNQQLYLAIGIPSILVILSWLSSRSDFSSLRSDLKALTKEFNDFRVEMAKELGKIDTRLAVIETKMNITAPREEKEPTAA